MVLAADQRGDIGTQTNARAMGLHRQLRPLLACCELWALAEMRGAYYCAISTQTEFGGSLTLWESLCATSLALCASCCKGSRSLTSSRTASGKTN